MGRWCRDGLAGREGGAGSVRCQRVCWLADDAGMGWPAMKLLVGAAGVQ